MHLHIFITIQAMADLLLPGGFLDLNSRENSGGAGYYSKLEDSGWLKHTRLILKAGIFAAEKLHLEGVYFVLHVFFITSNWILVSVMFYFVFDVDVCIFESVTFFHIGRFLLFMLQANSASYFETYHFTTRRHTIAKLDLVIVKSFTTWMLMRNFKWSLLHVNNIRYCVIFANRTKNYTSYIFNRSVRACTLLWWMG